MPRVVVCLLVCGWRVTLGEGEWVDEGRGVEGRLIQSKRSEEAEEEEEEGEASLFKAGAVN